MNPMQTLSTRKCTSKPPLKANTKKKRKLGENEVQIAKAPSDFSFAVAKIAVSQICQSVGFLRTQLYALETLTNVATRYLQVIAKSAVSFSNSSNRTHSNLFDLINAVHDLCSVQGFPTASEMHKNKLLSSGALKEIIKFVNLSNELAFAKLIPCKSFSQSSNPERPLDFGTSMGCDKPNLRVLHIPRWLPDFPVESLCKSCNQVVKERKYGEKLWEHSVPVAICGGNVKQNGEILQSNEVGGKEVKDGRKELARERGKLKFKIGKEKDQLVGLGVNMMKMVSK